MSNYAKDAFLDGRAIVGPEVVNGTGQVYLDVPGPTHLSNSDARELAVAIVAAADYAEERRREVDEW